MAASLPPSPPRRLAPHSTPKRGLSIAALGRSRAACFRRSGLGPPPYFTRVITLAPVTAGPSCVAGALRRGRRPQGGLTHGGGFESRAAMPSKSPLRRVHPRKRPCWRRAATSALGQEPPLPARSVKLDFRREFREKAPSPPCSARENVVSRTAYTSEESVPVLRRQRGGNLSFRH